jgi:raffinose/stachyose/melibiose transport system permease protein
MKTRSRLGKRVTFGVGGVLAFAYFFPFFLVFANSLKLKPDILENPLSIPLQITWDNFEQAFVKMNFFRSLTNSIIITVLSVSLLIIFSSMLAYYLARTKSKPSKYIFLILVA